MKMVHHWIQGESRLTSFGHTALLMFHFQISGEVYYEQNEIIRPSDVSAVPRSVFLLYRI